MDLIDQKIALTGATGFLGSHIARQLVARGARVIGVVRRPERGGFLLESGVDELRQADLMQPQALENAFRGCDAVISNAALSIRGSAPLSEFERANIEGAMNVARATAAAEVRRLVHISTIAVYRPQPNQVNGHDQMLLEGPRFSLSMLTTNWRYSWTKAKGEEAVRAFCQEADIGLTVLRPGPIYGSRDHKLTHTYAQKASGQLALAPTLRLPHVHASDVGTAVGGALANPNSAGHAYNVTGTPTSAHEVLSTWRELVGHGPLLIPIPVPLWIDWDDGPAERDLGFRPRSIREGIQEVLNAHNSTGD